MNKNKPLTEKDIWVETEDFDDGQLSIGLNVGDVKLHYEEDIEHGASRKKFIEEYDVLSALRLLREKIHEPDARFCDYHIKAIDDWIDECFQLKVEE